MCDVMYSPSIFSHLFFMIFSKSFTLPTQSIHVYLYIPMCLKDFVVFPDILSLSLLSVQHISFFADIKHMAYPAMLLCYAAVPDPALPRHEAAVDSRGAFQRFHDHLVIIVGNLTPIWIHLRAIRQCCFFRRRYNIPNTLLCLFIDREIIGIRIFYLIFLSGQIVQKVCTFLFLFAPALSFIYTFAVYPGLLHYHHKFLL